jgi:Mg/Co/Ni transporter MgtE
MNEQDTNKIKVAIANSFLQTVSVQQTLAILQEKALERATEELDSMTEEQREEVLTNVRAQEIAAEMKNQAPTTEEETSDNEESEAVSETSVQEES